MTPKIKIAVVGTVGIPANYGGFETLVEQLVQNKSSEVQYTIYCSSKSYNQKLKVYNEAKLEYINLKANGIQSILYDVISLIKASKNSDTILVLGVSGCAILPIFRLFSKKKLIINIDGLEHKRDKWNKFIRKFLKFSEAQAVKYGDVIITDNKGITDYVINEYGMSSELIAYGGDHVIQDVTNDEQQKILNQYNLLSEGYSLAICRIEPENNVHMILEAFEKTRKSLVFIGNWQKNEYGKALAKKYVDSKYVRITPSVYDLKILNILRRNCSFYLHGHSAGGTNPSLVEAMFFMKPIFAFDCVYNRESTENKAFYFKNVDELARLIGNTTTENKRNAADMYEIANRRYRWKFIARQYEMLYQ
jgi:glycosyltransferase involved in cell wall biosynthesis